MSLVLATLNYPPVAGGIEQLCFSLARELHALGIALTVAAPDAPSARALDSELPYPVRRYAGGRARHLRLAREVHSLVRSGHDHVLFAQWTGVGAFLAADAVLRERPRLSCLAHAKELLDTKHGLRATPLFAAYRRAVLERMQPVFAVSSYTAARARAAGAREVVVAHPGVDAARFHPDARASLPASLAEPSGPVLLSVARLVPRKGIDTVLESLPLLVRTHPGLRYLVAGEGPDRGRLEALVRARGLGAQVRFLGPVASEHLPALYASADLFVLASREDAHSGDVEGFGLVLLEAQASGTAVVAAESGGMPDALVPGETGLLVAQGDAEALARAVASLLEDGERLAHMRSAARQHAESQSWRAMAERVAGELRP